MMRRGLNLVLLIATFLQLGQLLVLRSADFRMLLENNSQDDYNHLISTLELSESNLPNVVRLLSSKEYSTLPHYHIRCHTMNRDEFYSIFDWVRKERHRKYLSLLMSQVCLARLRFRDEAQIALWNHGFETMIGDEVTMGVDDWIYVLRHSRPTPSHRWCERIPREVLLDPKFRRRANLITHLSSFCLFSSYSGKRAVLRAINEQILRVSPLSFSRLLLLLYWKRKQPSLTNFWKRKGRATDIFETLNQDFINSEETQFRKTLEACVRRRTLSNNHKALLLRMWLCRVTYDRNHFPHALLPIDLSDLGTQDYYALLTDITAWTPSEERARLLELLGLTEEDFIPIFRQDLSNQERLAIEIMPRHLQLAHYRYKFLSLPYISALRAKDNEWHPLPAVFNPPKYISGITLTHLYLKVASMSNHPYVFVNEGLIEVDTSQVTVLRPRLWIKENELRNLINIMFYAHVRFDRPIALLAPQYFRMVNLEETYCTRSEEIERQREIIDEDLKFCRMSDSKPMDCDNRMSEAYLFEIVSLMINLHRRVFLECIDSWKFKRVMSIQSIIKLLSELSPLDRSSNNPINTGERKR